MESKLIISTEFAILLFKILHTHSIHCGTDPMETWMTFECKEQVFFIMQNTTQHYLRVIKAQRLGKCNSAPSLHDKSTAVGTDKKRRGEPGID